MIEARLRAAILDLMPKKEGAWMTRNEVSEYLQVTPVMVSIYVSQHKLIGHKQGDKQNSPIRFKRKEVEIFYKKVTRN